MYELEEKIYFWGLVVLPVLFVFHLLLQLWKRRVQHNFLNSVALRRLAPDRSKTKSSLKLVAVSFFFLAICTALVNPKIGTRIETVKRKGVDVVFAIDVSKSMDAEDVSPSRIDKARHLVSQSIDLLTGDRVGIIVYAASAYPQLPITTDYSSAKMFLSAVNTNLMSSQGTAIGGAIDLAATFYDDDRSNRLMFIISDGEDHEASYKEAIDDAIEKGIKIFTIGVGTPKGAPIPIKRRGAVDSYKKNGKGEVVISRLNESVLKSIAKRGKGVYIGDNETKSVMDFVKSVLDNTDKKSFETKKFSDYKDQFQWFVALGILFLVIDTLILDRRTQWVQKLNLFNEKESANEF